MRHLPTQTKISPMTTQPQGMNTVKKGRESHNVVQYYLLPCPCPTQSHGSGHFGTHGSNPTLCLTSE